MYEKFDKDLFNFLQKTDNLEKVKKYNIIASDVENDIKTGDFINSYVYGIIKNKDKSLILSKYFDVQKDYWKYLIDCTKYKNTTFFYYNLSYDEAFIQPIIDHSKSIRLDTRVIKENFYKGNIYLDLNTKIFSNGGNIYDIQNISGIEFSLENWIQYLNLEKLYGIKKESLKNLELRVKNDTLATYYLVDFIQNFMNNTFNIKLRPTIASCSLNIYKNNYLPFTLARRKNKFISDIERESYYGGRNEIFIRGFLDIDSFDVRSMYLGIMQNCYIPIPNETFYIDNPNSLSKSWKYYYNNYLGIFDVLVYVPKQKICPLPYYVEKLQKIIYPCGTFRGIYTNVELINAEKYGLKILKVYKFLYYSKKEQIFKEFANDIWKYRMMYANKCINLYKKCNTCKFKDNEKSCKNYIENKNYNKPMDIMVKKIGNSQYGKYAEHHFNINYYGREADIPKKLLKLIHNPKTNESLIIDSFYNNDELYMIIKDSEKTDVSYTFTGISSFITSYARIKLLNKMKEFEKAIVYTDTDCIKLLHGEHNIISGESLGDFNFEYNKKEYMFSPKNYGNDDSRKIKGVKKDANCIKIDENNGTKTFEFEKPYKFRTAIRHNKIMAKWDKIQKTVTMTDNKRVWFGDKFFNQGVLSYPIILKYEGDKN